MAHLLFKVRWKSHSSLSSSGAGTGGQQSPLSVRSSSINSLSSPPNNNESAADQARIVELASDQLLRKRVAELLLDHNLNLLSAICQGTFVGDTASTISDCIIELLEQTNDYITDKFIKRVIRTKIYIYTSKRRKLTDLLRDNSISTTMLTTYMRQTASDYLRAVLEAPLTEALDFIGEGFTTKITMIDSAGNQKSSSTAGANTSSDESRIIKACAVLLDAILSSKALMPRNLRLLCRYIKTEVEHISKYPPPFSVPDEEGSPEGPNSQAVRPPSVRWEQEQQPSILSAKSTSAPGKLDGIDAFDSHSHNNQSPVSSLPIPAIANNSSSTTGAGVDFDNLQRTPPISALPTATVADQSSQLQKQHHHGQEPPLLAEQQQQQQQQRPRQNSPLVLWERVVSTFLFLRLIVPAITAPETFGLCRDIKISNQTRRGLISCGKVLNGLCSEMDFRVKEPQMTAAHQFIEDRRAELRDYVNYLAENRDSVIKYQDSLNRSITADGIFGQEAVRSEQSSPQQPPKHQDNQSGLLAGNQNMIDVRLAIHLARSFDRMEKDLMLTIRILPDVETVGVQEMFGRLREELSELISAMSAAGMASPKAPHSATLIARLARKISGTLLGGGSSGSISRLSESPKFGSSRSLAGKVGQSHNKF